MANTIQNSSCKRRAMDSVLDKREPEVGLLVFTGTLGVNRKVFSCL